MKCQNICCTWILFLALLESVTGQSPELVYHVTEGSASGFVGNPVKDGNLEASLGSISHFKFTFVSPNNSQSRFFKIDAALGDISTVEPLDRETICTVGVCPVNLDVAVQSLSSELELIQILRVRIRLYDVNDNAPTFPTQSVKLEILETTPVQTTFSVSAATDPDSAGNNSVISYDLQPPSGFGKFEMEVIKNWDGSFDIGITVKSRLDREVVDFYQLTIIAKDGGNPSLTGSLTINITVTDSNDHIPVFSQQLYNVTIQENVTRGTEILRLATNDRDIGVNGQVRYSFNTRSAAKIGSVFRIDEKTGALIVDGSVDFETSRTYQLVVEARDNGVPPKSSQAAVIIHVLDVNDNPPDIKFNLLAGGDHALVSELAKPGSFVAHVSIEDPDTDADQRIACKMESSEFDLQKMSEKEYKIILLRKLNRAEQAEYNLTVRCEDNGTPSLQSTSSLQVKVKDENDNAPVFQQKTYQVTITENFPIGKSIIKVQATDTDFGVNGEITYELTDSDNAELISVDNTTGVIRATGNLDREMSENITVKIIGKDNGRPRMSATATVIIKLEDVNDVAPIFSQSEYVLNVKESQEIDGLNVVRVNDPDLGLGGEFYYTLQESTASPGVFQISEADGSIKATQKFDREDEDEYRLVIMATDRGNPPLSTSATVLIKVQDINDNTPVILYPSPLNNSVETTSWTMDSFVTKITATDRDIGENGRLTYAIENSDSVEFLYIDQNDGIVRLARNIDASFSGSYEITLLVKDNGEPVRSARQTFNLFIGSANRTALSDTSGSTSSNMAIVIAVVAITAIVSLAILVVICAVRKHDKNKNKFPPQLEERKIMQRRGSSSTASKTSQRSDLSTVTCLDELRKDSSFAISDVSHGLPCGRSTSTSCYIFRCDDKQLNVDDSKELEVLNTAYVEQRYDVFQVPSKKQEVYNRELLQICPENNNTTKTRKDSDISSEGLTSSDSGRGGSEEDLHDKNHMSQYLGSSPETAQGDYYVRFMRPSYNGTDNSPPTLSSFRPQPGVKKQEEENHYYDMTVLRKSGKHAQRGRPANTGATERSVSPTARPVSLYVPNDHSRMDFPVCADSRSVSEASMQPFWQSTDGSKTKMSSCDKDRPTTDSRSYSIELQDLGASTSI